jgi:dTDP-4-amino-4,6-dideoxygalactose transaminase
MIGRFGKAEVFSFHSTKFFNTFEGGAVATNDDQLAEKMRLMRNFGFSGYDNVIHEGTNGKMIEACAAMGLVNLAELDKVVQANAENYNHYAIGLEGVPGLRLIKYNKSELNNFQYVVVEVLQDCPVTRDYIVSALHAENILARKYFWPGCHMMMPYRELYPLAKTGLRCTEDLASSVIVLPTGTAVDSEKIYKITQIIRSICMVQHHEK